MLILDFIANTPIYGAGISLFASSRLNNSYTHIVIFGFCTWELNYYPVSVAVDIAPDVSQQTDSNFIVEPLLFKNCQIIYHNPNPMKGNNSTLFIGKSTLKDKQYLYTIIKQLYVLFQLLS